MKWIAALFIATVATAVPLEKVPVHDDKSLKLDLLYEHILTKSDMPDYGYWTTIAEIDISKGDDCPAPWLKVAPIQFPVCRAPSNDSGCYSAFFSVHNQSYTEIIGALRGYQKGTTDAFGLYGSGGVSRSVNKEYVDGVSITTQRKHVWTYAIGASIDFDWPQYNCPCSTIPGPRSPPFVGEHYYCQSGSWGRGRNKRYSPNPLWQGINCPPDNSCCAYAGAPVFYRNFQLKYNDDIEVRICTDQPYSDEAVLIDQLSLYVR